jgi:hypothetical protein
MTINYEIKSQLAKLLATEDLVVENRNIETAQFDVENRILTLPMWKRASNVVYDMLVGHEVGHALFTPNDWSWEDRIPKQFVNVVEDARIEKLMKRRYPGLSKSFYKGYQELSEKDFFCLEEEDISTYNLADRANLWFKIGNFVNIPIDSGEEMELINMISETKTFDDVVKVAEILYKYCKLENEETQNITLPNPTPGNVEGDSDSSDDETEETTETEESVEQSQSNGDSDQNLNSSTPDKTGDDIEVQTDEIFNSGAQEFNGDLSNSSHHPNYIEVPEVNIHELVVRNARIHEELESSWKQQTTVETFFNPYTSAYEKTTPIDPSRVDGEYYQFKKSATKEVNYLVKEFECKKSADSYSRSFTSKTGTLDCTKLHTYKYNEDLFKKVNVIPDGKNHGLIFILDWSGSMSDYLIETTKQLYNLVWFCSKVNIPFDVYAFTSSYIKFDKVVSKYDGIVQEVKENNLVVEPEFSLLQFLTSDVSKKELEKQMISFWRLINSQKDYWFNFKIPNGYGLSSTPLNEAIICLHEIIPQFQKKNKVQKVNTIILTDGEASPLPYYKRYDYQNDNRIGLSRCYAKDYIRNRKTGYTYKLNHEYYKFTDILLENVKQSFPDVNFIGFRITSNFEFRSFIKRYNPLINEENFKKLKKQKSVDIKNSGYTSYFGIITSSLNNETEFNVEEGATKSKIKNAFVKNLNSKSLNKKVLTQFVDIIS